MARRSHQIRIIAGRWRGRRLSVADLPGLRPTTDRVRETLFNWLMHDIPGARCLDLFAGSGALGLECLSRGGAFVQFVESNRVAATYLAKVIADLDLRQDGNEVALVEQDALQFLALPPGKPFDVVFLDPPFSDDFLPSVIARLDEQAWLASGAKIYLEQAARDASVEVPDCWHELRSKVAGESSFSLYQKA